MRAAGNNFGQEEGRDGGHTQGSYYVHLPDGRLQTVTYRVDGGSGYIADVKYDGQARYDSGSFESFESFEVPRRYSAPSRPRPSAPSRPRPSAPVRAAPVRRLFDSRESFERFNSFDNSLDHSFQRFDSFENSRDHSLPRFDSFETSREDHSFPRFDSREDSHEFPRNPFLRGSKGYF